MSVSTSRPCAVCKKPAMKAGNKFWPLCSERCQFVDLGKWLGEEYRVAGEPDLEALDAVAEAVDAEQNKPE